MVSWEGDRGNSRQAPECLPRRVIFEEVGDTVESSPTQDFPTVTLADVMKGHDDKAPRNSTGCGSASDSDLSAERSIHAQVAALEADTPHKSLSWIQKG